MRELTSLEIRAVSGGVMAPAPRPVPGNPAVRLIVRLILAILHLGRPTMPPTKAVA
jgi:hypothetical protein